MTDALIGPVEPPELHVMTYNIRYGTADDGPNRWDRRKEFLVETIRTFDPDLLGTQETLKFQRDYLAEQLPGYAAIGVGRNDGRDDGVLHGPPPAGPRVALVRLDQEDVRDAVPPAPRDRCLRSERAPTRDDDDVRVGVAERAEDPGRQRVVVPEDARGARHAPAVE